MKNFSFWFFQVADGDGENKNSSHYFQSALFEYLDTEAPTLGLERNF